MNPIDTTGALAQEVMRDRIERGRRSRLAAIARCCHPRRWRQVAGAVRAAVRALPRHHAARAAACC